MATRIDCSATRTRADATSPFDPSRRPAPALARSGLRRIPKAENDRSRWRFALDRRRRRHHGMALRPPLGHGLSGRRHPTGRGRRGPRPRHPMAASALTEIAGRPPRELAPTPLRRFTHSARPPSAIDRVRCEPVSTLRGDANGITEWCRGGCNCVSSWRLHAAPNQIRADQSKQGARSENAPLPLSADSRPRPARRQLATGSATGPSQRPAAMRTASRSGPGATGIAS